MQPALAGQNHGLIVVNHRACFGGDLAHLGLAWQHVVGGDRTLSKRGVRPSGPIRNWWTEIPDVAYEIDEQHVFTGSDGWWSVEFGYAQSWIEINGSISGEAKHKSAGAGDVELVAAIG